MSSIDTNKNIIDIYDLIQEIIDNSPIELTQLRIDTALDKYYNVVDDILENSPVSLCQIRIDNINMQEDYF